MKNRHTVDDVDDIIREIEGQEFWTFKTIYSDSSIGRVDVEVHDVTGDPFVLFTAHVKGKDGAIGSKEGSTTVFKTLRRALSHLLKK